MTVPFDPAAAAVDGQTRRRNEEAARAEGGEEAGASIGDGAASAATVSMLFAFGGAGAAMAGAWRPGAAEAPPGLVPADLAELSPPTDAPAAAPATSQGPPSRHDPSAPPPMPDGAPAASASFAFPAGPDWTAPRFDADGAAPDQVPIDIAADPAARAAFVAGGASTTAAPAAAGATDRADDPAPRPTGDPQGRSAEAPRDRPADAPPTPSPADADVHAPAAPFVLKLRDADDAAEAIDETADAGAGIGVAFVAEGLPDLSDVRFDLSDPRFAVDPGGVVRVVEGAVFDAETEATVALDVVARSSDGTTSTHRFEIAVDDVNEHSISAVEDRDASRDALAEDAAAGAEAGLTLHAPDADRDDVVTYELSDDRFAVDAAGVVRVAEGAVFDAETEATVALDVVARSSDGSVASRRFDIAVDDVNEHAVAAPVDRDAAPNSLAETAGAGTALGLNLFAEDADRDDSAALTLSDDRFEVDALGEVRVAEGAVFDAETEGVIALKATATSSDGSAASRVFAIAVADMDEAPVDLDVEAVAPRVFGDAAVLSVRIGGEAYRGDPEYIIEVDGREVARGEVDWSRDTLAHGRYTRHGAVNDGDVVDADVAWRDIEVEIPLPPGGIGKVRVTFPDDAYETGVGDRNLIVDRIALDGHEIAAEEAFYDLRSGADRSGQEAIHWTGALVFDAAPLFDDAARAAPPDDADLAIVEGADGAVIARLSAVDPEGGPLSYEVSDPRFEVVDGDLRLRDADAFDAVAEPRLTLEVAAVDAAGQRISTPLDVAVLPAHADADLTVADEDAAHAVIARGAGPGDALGLDLAVLHDGHETPAELALDDARFTLDEDGVVRIADGAVFAPGETIALTVTAATPNGPGTARVFDVLVEGEAAPSDPEPLLHLRDFGAPGDAVRNEARDDHHGEVQADGWTWVRDAPAFDIDAGTLAISWDAPDDGSSYALFSRDSRHFDGGGHLLVVVEGGQVKVRLQSDVESYWLDAPIAAGEANTVALRFGADEDGGGMTLFVNGEALDASAYDGGMGGNDEGIVVGGRDWQSGDGVEDGVDRIFEGEIHGVMLFDERLDDAAVAALDPGAAPDYAALAPDPPAAPAPAPDPVPDPILRLTDFDASDGAVADETGSGHDGAVQPDGWTLVEDSAAFDIPSGALSLTFRADDVVANQGLFSRDSMHYDGGGHLSVWVENGEVVVRLQSDENSHYVRADVTAGEATSVVIAFGEGGDGAPAGLRLYVNGELADVDAYDGGLAGNDEPIVIGATQRRSGDAKADRIENVLDGEMLSVELYDRPLTDAQAQDLGALGLRVAFADGDGVLESAEGGPGLDAHDPGDGPVARLGAGPDLDDSGGFVLLDDPSGKFETRGDELWLRDGEALDHEAAPAHALSLGVKAGDGSVRAFDVRLDVLDAAGERAGGDGDDTLHGSAENDVIHGAAGDDSLSGGAGGDVFVNEGALEGLDRIDGGEGEDAWQGGAGDDVFWVEDGFANLTSVETIEGGEGHDVVRGTQGDDVLNLFAAPEMSGIEAVQGGAGDDVLVADDAGRRLEGGAGDDALVGGAGEDVLVGGDGDDVFSNFEGRDRVEGGEGDLDALNLAEAAEAGPRPWTLELDEGSEVVSDEDGVMTLSEDASGEIVYDDGSSVEFSQIEQINY